MAVGQIDILGNGPKNRETVWEINILQMKHVGGYRASTRCVLCNLVTRMNTQDAYKDSLPILNFIVSYSQLISGQHLVCWCLGAAMWQGIHRPFLNSLWLSDATERHRSISTFAQVMACCLTTPSQHPNRCWPIISEAYWHSSLINLTRHTSAINY